MPSTERAVAAAAVIFFATASAPAQQRVALTEGFELAPEVVEGERPVTGWRPVSVPSTFEDVLGPAFDGTCWYRVTVPRPPSSEGARFRVLFHGVATAARVFADGVEVGDHLGAWTPWYVDVTDALANGEALVEVRVDERVGHNTQGFLPVIQPHVGGMWRSIELCVDRSAVLDREKAFVFGDGSAAGPGVKFEVPVLGAEIAGELALRAVLRDGDTVLGRREVRLPSVSGRIDAPAEVRRWAPDRPELYRVRIELLEPRTGRVLDRIERRVGFRELRADGTRVLWNGRPLQLRGMLDWGYVGPRLAPPEDEAFWRRRLETVKALGCNMVKACLWMPPRAFYDVADEIGLLVWQEYPTWHPQLTQRHLDELRREYDEFYRYDRSHPSVAIRSLTCETGHSAELAVIRALYDRCKELVPQTLVVDDSAWIEWHRVHDFWDDHPYGNNSWWPGKLAQMREYIAQREAKPLLLGECIAADTWLDLAAWDERGVDDGAWWAPWCIEPQRAFEAMVEERFGPRTRASLRPVSLAYALRNRKYQVERLRLSAPDAGYTLSVIRDFPKARMGFVDDFGELKWPAADWAWQRDTLIALDTDGDRRALAPGRSDLPVRIAHYGRGPLAGRLTLALPEWSSSRSFAVELAEGAVSDRFALAVDLPDVERPTRFRVTAELEGSHPARNAWDLWVLPRPAGRLDPEVRVVERLDRDTLSFVAAGGRALLLAGDRKGSLKTEGIWFLKGAPWAPPHPLHEQLPADFLIELQSFDLEVARVLRGERWIGCVDPVLAFWDTHDVAAVNPWLLAFTAKLGRGRFGATVLNHESPAGQLVLERMVNWLAHGPEPKSALPDELVESLAGAVRAEVVDLVEWKIATDPEDRGVADGWMDGGEHAGADWRSIRAGAHWEAQGLEHYDGVAWYRTTLAVPARWSDETVTAVFEGVDDSYRLYVNGTEVGRFGDPATGETVWLVRTTADLTPHLRQGEDNEIVLRVVDHVGAGGLHRPAFVTTGPADDTGDLLH